MIAAPRSGSGKTTLTLGLLRAFRRRGVAAVGLKSGPDYIDPAFHAAASGREGVNLDSWAMPPELLGALAAEATAGRALALCEASMGLFDGVPAPPGRSGASADVAAALGLPVLLVVDVSGQAQSAAAVVKGCAAYDERLRIAGVVINRVGSERHRRLVTRGGRGAGDSRSSARCRATTRSPCPSAISGSCRRARRRRSRRGSTRWPTSSKGARRLRAHSGAGGRDEPPCAVGEVCGAPAPRPKDRAAARRSLFLHLSASRSRLAGGRGGDRRLFAARRRAAALRLRRVLAPGRLSRTARRKARRRAPIHARPAALRRNEARSRRVRRLHGARREPRRRLGGGARDGGAARRRDEFRQAPHDARLSGGEACGRLRARARRRRSCAATSSITRRSPTQGSDEPFAFVADAYGGPPQAAGSRRGLVTGSFFHAIAEA